MAPRFEPTQLVHAFNLGRFATALCGASNDDDGDAPATEDQQFVTCRACRRLLVITTDQLIIDSYR